MSEVDAVAKHCSHRKWGFCTVDKPVGNPCNPKADYCRLSVKEPVEIEAQ